MIKLIATDLDGTLLNHKNEISKENIEAINMANKKGVKVVIATGRSHFDVLSILSKADIQCDIISNNGACIHDKNKNKLYSIAISQKELIESVTWLDKEGFYYEVSNDKNIYTPFDPISFLGMELDKLSTSNPEIDKNNLIAYAKKMLIQRGIIKVDNCQDIFNTNEDFFNILAFSFDKNKIKKGIEYFKKFKNFYVFSSAKHNFEMINVQTSKGDALKKLCSLAKISLENSMAIGDNFNDLTMIEKAKYGIAMGNAEEKIKSISNFITLNNDENGVAYAIHKFID